MLMVLATIISYWAFNRTLLLFDNRFAVFYTALMYGLLSCVGAKVFRTYSGVLRYSSFVDLVHVAYANGLNLVIAAVLSKVLQDSGLESIAVLSLTETCVAFILAMLAMWGLRVFIKTLYDVAFNSKRAMRVFIYGDLADAVGLAKNIKSQRPLQFKLCGFISHDNRAKHMLLMGQKVFHIDSDIKSIIERNSIKGVLVSPASLKEFRDNQDFQNILIACGCKIYMTQSHEAKIKDGHLTDEEVGNMQLTEVSVEDLLPREEIDVDLKAVGELLSGKCILITGSAGSIGSEMVRQIAVFQPKKMILIDQAETPQHDIRLMMKEQFPDIDAEVIVTSIDHRGRMDSIFSIYRPDYVFHAAAYKHVPMMEDNPSEAVLNNVYGTKVIADLSVKYGVKKFVMISTDKAVNPTNVMGCSKRICEIYVQSLNQKLQREYQEKLKEDPHATGHTQFVTTRFGNVLGSNGSVIPLFREQIKKGGPLTVTDERIVRFFMLIPEACKLVLEAGTMGNGGEIFVFDMGKPVKIVDLAKRMIALSGVKNIGIQFTGLREGEKLYEEVLSDLENTKPTFNKKIRIAEVREYDYENVCVQIDELMTISTEYDNMATVKKMKEIVPEYKSNNSVYEQLDH
jgi:FlaA1/EpsC-like NDP-sugar epimerase